VPPGSQGCDTSDGAAARTLTLGASRSLVIGEFLLPSSAMTTAFLRVMARGLCETDHEQYRENSRVHIHSRAERVDRLALPARFGADPPST
jgi:hypothetical protein